MKRFLYTITTLLFIASILFATPFPVLADEGDGGVHGLEVEVNGYHVTLSNPNEWAKGENTVIVTIADEMGMPLTDTEVELLIAPKASAGHGEAEADEHPAPEADIHSPAPEPDGHDAMPGMDMGEPTEEVDSHGTSAQEAPAHGEEEMTNPVAMRAADEHGMYIAETHLEKTGEHEVLVMFHVNGEMIEAAFTVEIPGTGSKTVVLWSFALINMGLIASAGYMKKQSIPVKGAK
jgi:hypothetical protein